MTVSSIQRDWGTNPSIVRMETDEFIEDIVQTGWLATQQASIDKANKGGFTWKKGDAILLRYPLDQNNPTGQKAMTLVYVFDNFTSINPLSPVYPNRQGVVAAAGGGQTNATVLNIGINVVSTAATAGDSVKLPLDVSSQTVIIVNRGANSINVFPQLGDRINNLAVNASFAVAAGTQVFFVGVDSTAWATFV